MKFTLKQIEDLIGEISDKNMEYMESCEPDCDEVRHARHQGSWDHFWKMERYLEAKLSSMKGNK